ncbi:GGDEF domain-containing protein [Colwellia sp. UCD-KL20]|uniref:GGDEF domain-containing protein n=1 Tax=Colwellia sp. UCD-KL20 TaxID=1917165 RepID=UPI00097051B4|nr:GGDEF domain-containing protein [Colwellia sp. UCD-KL20]
MNRKKLILILIVLSSTLIISIYSTYKRYSNLQNTMDIQNTIFQLVKLKSADAVWNYELNSIHSDNFPHFDRVNEAANHYHKEMMLFLDISRNIKEPFNNLTTLLPTLSLQKKSRMNDYLSEVAIIRNSLKFLDTLLFSLNKTVENDKFVLKFLADAQYQLSKSIALNQRINLKGPISSNQCIHCTEQQIKTVNAINLHLKILNNQIVLSHQARDAFFNSEHSDLLTTLFDELSLIYVKTDAKHETIKSQILTLTLILVITLVTLFLLFYLLYRTIDEHRAAGITDPLTGLYNRKKLIESLPIFMASHVKYGQKFSLLFIDLDGFKGVNDTYGHDIGDKLLQKLSTRLTNSVRKQDSIYRIGGDEFVVVVQGIDNAEEAKNMAENLLTKCNRKYELEGNKCIVTLSIGISLFPEHAVTPDDLLKCADEAMYYSKNHGKDRVTVWNKKHN